MPGTSIASVFVDIIPTVQGIQGNLGQAFRPAEQEADAAGGRAGKKFAVVAAGAIAAGGAVVGVALKKLFDVGSVFDDVSDTIRAGTGRSGAALEELSGVATRVATEIPTSFEQASATVTKVTQRLGLTGDALTTVSEQFIQAGAVLGQDVDIDAATQALSVFGVTGDAVSGQLDSLFRISQSTGVGINELTSAAAAQAPALQELGFNLDQTAGLIGSLDKAGLNATAITASMGKGLVKLAKDGEAPQEAFQRITGQLGDLVAQGDTAAAIDLASGIFGTKGATQMVAAIQSGTLNMETLSAAAAGTGDTILGVGEETADAAENWTLFKNKAIAALQPAGDAVFGLAGGAMAKLNESFDDVLAVIDLLRTGDFKGGIFGLEEDSPFIGVLFSLRDIVKEIGATVGPIFKELFAQIAPIFEEVGAVLGPAFVDVFNTLKPAVQQLLPIVTQLLPVFNPVGLLFRALLPILPQIANVIGELARVIAGALAKALEALAPLFQAVVGVIQKLLPFITNLVASLLPPLMSLFEQLAPLLDAVLGALVPVVDAIVAALIPAIDALMPVVELVFGFIATTIQNVMTIIGGVIDVLTGVFTGDWNKVWTGIQEIFGGVWDQIKNILSTAWNVIVEIFTNIGPTLLGIITSFEGKLIEWGAQFLGWLWDGIKQVFVLVLDWFASMPGWIWEQITVLTSVIVDYGTQFLQWIWDGITNLFPAILQWFSDLPATAWAGVVALTSTIIGYGSAFIGWIKDGIVTGAQAIWTFITDLPGEIGKLLVGLGSKLIQLGKDLVGKIVEGVKAVAGSIWDAITAALTGGGETIGEDGLPTSGPRVLGKRDGGLVGSNFRGQADGGPVQRYPSGFISGPGGPRDDTVPTWLSNGEFVVNARSTAAFGPLLEEINDAGRMASGGVVGTMAAAKQYGSDQAWLRAKELIEESKKSPASNGNWGPGVSGAFAANTAAAKAYIEGHFGGVSSIGGLYGGSVPGSDHPMGKALDVMIANYRSSAGIAAGNAIADWFQNNPNAFGTKYEIWRKQYREPGQPWGPYSHPSGSNDTLDHFDHVHLSFLTGSGQFAASNVAAGAGGDTPSVMASLLSKAQTKLGIAGMPGGGGMPAPVTGGAFAPNVERWRPTVLQSLALLRGKGLDGNPAYANTVLNQVRSESSGDPNAANLTDSNARRGDPSIGLVQVIKSTFTSMLQRYGFADLIPLGQRNPLASLVAGELWSIFNYKSIPAGMRGVAYANGGIVPGFGNKDTEWGRLTPGEGVFTKPQTDAIITHAKALEAGFAGQMPTIELHNYIDGKQFDSRTVMIVDGRIVDIVDAVDRNAMQSL